MTVKGKPKHLLLIGNCDDDKARFASLVTIVRYVIKNLVSGNISTKRDVYYQSVAVFKTQSHCDQLLDWLSHSLAVSLREMLIYPNQKSLIYGKLAADEDSFVSNSIRLLPVSQDFSSINKNISLVILVEKDAVFKRFCYYFCKIYPQYIKKVLFITSKGYPDNLTKSFLQSLLLHIDVPVLAFNDSDIYGLSIFKSYKYFTKSNLSDRLIFLGVFLLEYNHGWLTIRLRDFKLMISFLNTLKDLILSAQTEQEKLELLKWKRETTRGMLLFKKAEMNIVGSKSDTNSLEIQASTNNINTYLMSKILSYLPQ